ncbi:recombinase family protein [Amycolatopsis sp. NPDC051373]|uniref:recombinase family protein n=1 Tax=Amycolatopsis sp. NPDC051373 TaxID=3155801 RepID=UPI003450984C
MVSTSSNSALSMRLYLRVSFDRSGRQRSPGEQCDDLKGDCERESFRYYGEDYTDLVSASRYAAKARDDFPLMLADLEAGTFGADILGLWETSRGTRKAGEMAHLLDLLAAQRKLVWVHTHHRLYDPRIARDWRALMEDSVHDEYSSRETSDRVLRTVEAGALRGDAFAQAPFGYKHTFDARTGKFEARVIDEPAAEIVREVFKRWLAGEDMAAIARDLDKRGVEKPSGGAFSPSHLRCWLLTPAYTGLRVHRPGRGKGGRRSVTPDLYEASWPAIIDREEWHRVQARRADPSRARFRPGRARHLLGGIARCGVCGGPMHRTKPVPPKSDPKRVKNMAERYRCQQGGHASVIKGQLDALVRRVLLAYLSGDAYAELVQSGTDRSVELDAAELAWAKAKADLADLKAKVRAGTLTLDFAADVEPGIRERESSASAAVERLKRPPALAGLLEPGEDIVKRWRVMAPSAKRELVQTLLVPELLGELRVLRNPVKGVAAPLRDRVHFHRGDECRTGPCGDVSTRVLP